MNERTGVSARRETSGRYANYFEVGQNAFEFLLDFGQATPANATPRPHTRIVMSPQMARELLKVLGKAVARHEDEHRGEHEAVE